MLKHLFTCIIISAGLWAGTSHSGIATDGSVGPAQTLAGPDFVIPNTLGTQRGANLFHSFGRFSITSTESATFTSDFTGVTDNIISRITGVGASTIDGLLANTVPGADLWLINPNGVIFGPNASLDLLGGLHTTTAHYVVLQDGGRFGTDLSDPNNTLLTTTSISAFGFLSATPGIEVQAVLEVPVGEPISLVGGDVNISGTVLARLGDVQLVGTAGTGEAKLGADGFVTDASLASFADLADVSVTGDVNAPIISVNAAVNTSGGSGRIYIRGDTFVSNGFIVADARDMDGRDRAVDVHATQSIEISGGFIGSGALGSGQGGSVFYRAPTIVLSGSGEINNGVFDAAGSGGRVTVEADQLFILDDAAITANTLGGDAGGITISGYSALGAQLIALLGRSARIGSDSLGGATGQSGDIELHATELFISTLTGPLTIPGGITSENQNGRGGDITLNVDVLNMESGVLSTSSTGSGRAGNLTIQGLGSTADNIVPASSVTVRALNDRALVQTTSNSLFANAGDAGVLTITVRDLSVSDGADISATTQNGAGGAIVLNVDRLQVGRPDAEFSLNITTVTSSTDGPGDAGSVLIQGSASANGIPVPAETVSVLEPVGGILSNSFSPMPGAGRAGNININADSVVVGNASNISAVTFAGAGGNIELDVGDLTVQQESFVVADTFGIGDAGSITVRNGMDANGNSLLAQSVIVDSARVGSRSASTGSNAGSAGDITINSELLTVSNGAEITAETLQGAGGNISLNVAELSLLDAGQVRTNTSGLGQGGTINIAVDDLSLSSDARIFAAATPDDDVIDASIGYDTGRAPDLQLFGTLGSGSVLGLSALPVDLGAPALPFAYIAAFDNTVGFFQPDLLAITPFEVDDNSSPFGNGFAPMVRGVSNGSDVPVEFLLTGVPDVGFTGDHDEFGDFLVALQYLELRALQLGNAGNINITGLSGPSALSVRMDDGGVINSTSDGETFRFVPVAAVPDAFIDVQAGQAGSVTINAQTIDITDGAAILVNTVDGQGGFVNLQVDNLTLQSGAIVAASTQGAGNAGEITIEGTSSPGVSALISDASITTSTSGAGFAGSIRIDMQDVRLQNLAEISVRSTANGSAGSVIVNANTLSIDNSIIEARAANAVGGDVVLNLNKALHMTGGIVQASAQGLGVGDSGGNVTIGLPQAVTLNQSQIRADANAGAGGNINIVTRTFVQSADSAVTATSQSNVDGLVQVEAINQITGDVVEVDLPEVSQPMPLRQRCTPRQIQDRSSLVVDGTPPGAVRSPYLEGESTSRSQIGC